MYNLIKAFKIFAKYSDSSHPTGCEHDTLYVYVDPAKVSDEAKERLNELGFIADDELGRFYSFRYGSA